MKPASSAPKPRDTKGTILRLLRTMTRESALFALALALTVAGNLLALAGPKLAGEAIDAIGQDAILWPVIARKCALMLA